MVLRRLAVVFAVAVVAGQIRAGESLRASQTNSTNGFYRLGFDARMFLEAGGFRPKEVVQASYVVVDEFERERHANPFSFTADEKGAWKGELKMPTDRFGFFRARVKTASGTALAKQGSCPAGCLTYAVVRAMDERPKLTEDECFFGAYGNGPGDVTAWLGMHLNFGASIPTADPVRAAEAKVRRSQAAWAHWGTAPPGNTHFLNAFCSPEARRFMKATTENRREAFRVLRDPEGRRHYVETYRKFVTACREQFPDRRRIYECQLEPDINVDRPEQIVDAFAAVYDAIHEVDPEGLVAGPDYSTVMDVEAHRKIFELGIARYIDVFALHPYCSYPPEPGGFIRRLRATDQIVEKAKGRPIMKVATEGGFATPATKEGELLQMNGLVRKQLILLGEGYQFSYAFYPHDYGNDFGDDHDGDYGFTYNLHLAQTGQSTPQQRWGISRVSPRPVAPALAAASWYLDGKRPVSCIDYLGGGTHGYAYADKSNAVVLALWNYGGGTAEVDLPVGCASLRVADHMGNERTAEAPGGILHLTLGASPVYVLEPAREIWGRGARRAVSLASGDLDVAAGDTFELRGTAAERGTVELCANRPFGLAGERRAVEAGAFSFRIPVPDSLAEGDYPVMVRFHDAQGRLASIAGKGVSVRAPVAVLSAEPTCAKGVFGLRVTVENLTAEARRVTLGTRVLGVPEARRTQTAEIPARSRATVDFAFPGMAAVPFEFRALELTTGLPDGRRWVQNRKFNFLAAAHVPGGLAAWTNVAYQAFADDVRLAFAWNADGLMVDALVDDDAFANEQTMFYTWSGDSIQFAFASTILEKSSANNLRDVLQEAYTEQTLALARGRAEVYRTVTFDPVRFPAGVTGEGVIPEADVPREIARQELPGGGTRVRYRALFPWRFLNRGDVKAGESAFFSACINDWDPGRPSNRQRHVFDFKAAAPKGFGRIILAD